MENETEITNRISIPKNNAGLTEFTLLKKNVNRTANMANMRKTINSNLKQ
jgi:hypothetical protein